MSKSRILRTTAAAVAGGLVLGVATAAPAEAQTAKQHNRAIAKTLVKKRHWSNTQYTCLVKLWNRESGWSTKAGRVGGAYGIPQALPGRKMASAGKHWRYDATTQITWGLKYIKGRYGTPCKAWGHSQRTGWY